MDNIPARSTDPITSKQAAVLAADNAATQIEKLESIYRRYYQEHPGIGLTNWDVKVLGNFNQVSDFSSRIKTMRNLGIIVQTGRRHPIFAPERLQQNAHAWVPLNQRHTEKIPSILDIL